MKIQEIKDILLENYSCISENNILLGKHLTDIARVCFNNYLRRNGRDRYGSLADKGMLGFNVYCEDPNMQLLPEVEKVTQWLEQNEGVEFYWIECNGHSIFGEHERTLFMPEDLKIKSEANDWHDRYNNNKWHQCCRVWLSGNLSDLIEDGVLTKSEAMKLIKKELEQ